MSFFFKGSYSTLVTEMRELEEGMANMSRLSSTTRQGSKFDVSFHKYLIFTN